MWKYFSTIEEVKRFADDNKRFYIRGFSKEGWYKLSYLSLWLYLINIESEIKGLKSERDEIDKEIKKLEEIKLNGHKR